MNHVRLFHTPDGGEIEFVNGVLTMSNGLESAVYLSWFGGNEADSGAAVHDAKQWWGNLGEADPAFQYRSETQFVIRALPPLPTNLRRIEQAAARDLAWMAAAAVAEVKTVSATIPARNRILLLAELESEGSRFPVAVEADWKP